MEMETPREVELKLEVGAADLERLARHPWLAQISEGRPVTRALRSVYFDTPELALWRRGLVLRVREIGRRRLVGAKTRGVARGGLVAREEAEALLRWAGPDLRSVPRAELLAAIPDRRLARAIGREVAGRRLVPRVETRVRRTQRRLRLGVARVELALDAGEVRAGRRSLPIRELELERIAGPLRALHDVALHLAAEVALRPGLIGKAERGFALLLGEEPAPSRAEPIVLERNASLDAVLAAVLGECLRQVAANQPAAERGADPEGVHQMRVGVRRLRSALRLFDEWLPERTARALCEELRWLGRELGRARDLDVFLFELLARLGQERPDDIGLKALREAAETARAEAYAGVRAALAPPRYTLLVLRLGRFVEGAEWRRRGAARVATPARPTARRLLRHRAERLHQLGDRLAELSARDLHRLRIRAKRLRYAIELLGSLFGGKAPARAARRLAELQDALGHLNDQVTAERLVAELHAKLGPDAAPDVARAEGFVMGYAARSVAAGSDALAESWRRVARLDPFWT
jgi:inorganic triphosphatase YgiF